MNQKEASTAWCEGHGKVSAEMLPGSFRIPSDALSLQLYNGQTPFREAALRLLESIAGERTEPPHSSLITDGCGRINGSAPSSGTSLRQNLHCSGAALWDWAHVTLCRTLPHITRSHGFLLSPVPFPDSPTSLSLGTFPNQTGIFTSGSAFWELDLRQPP